MSPLVRRVIASLGANAFAQAANVTMQLLSLPLFLHQWNAATYGTWLMLSAIPAYLSMADVGMVNTAGNRMTMAMGQGDTALANRVFQSAQVFMMVACAVMAVVALPAVMLAPIPGLSNVDERTALAALTSGVLMLLYSGLSDAMFRATGRYALGTTLSNVLRLCEWGFGLLGLYLWGTFSAVAWMSLAMRVVGLIGLGWMASRDAQGLTWGVRDARWAEVRAMTRPALSFMMFPLTNALTFQGSTLLVGHLLGPAMVTVFNTYRTLARVAVQLTGVFSFALWAEFSRLYGKGGAEAVVGLYKRSTRLGSLMAVGLSVVLYLAGPLLLRLWTHGAIAYDGRLMVILLAYAAAGGIQHVSRVMLMAVNQHMGLAQWALGSAVFMLVLGAGLAASMGVAGVSLAMLLAEALMTTVCLVLAHRLLHPAPAAGQESVA